MKPITSDDPAVGYIPNYPEVDSLTIILRSGSHSVVPCDPVRRVDMGHPSDDCTLTLKSGRIIKRNRELFKTEETIWISAGHNRDFKGVE
jgi:hypothetical protein